MSQAGGCTHLAVIPGFGMLGKDLGVFSKDWLSVTNFDPSWCNCASLTEVAEELAPRLSDWALSRAANDNVVIYGFSVGADLLMEMSLAESRRLVVPPKTHLLLADPNVSLETCFITGLAADPACNSFDVFIGEIRRLVTDASSAEVSEHWLRYLEAIERNSVVMDWVSLHRIAETVVAGAESRFKKFMNNSLDAEGCRRTGAQEVWIEFSQESYTVFQSSLQYYRNSPWIHAVPAMQHFHLSDPGQVRSLVEQVVNARKA